MEAINTTSAGSNRPRSPYPPLRSIRDLAPVSEDDPSYLLRNRLLRRGEVAALVGTAGLGKSTIATQLAMMWSAGLPAMGLEPLNPMRTVMIQCENDEADMALITHGIETSLGLEPQTTRLLVENFRVAEVRKGSHIMEVIADYWRQHSPQLVILDPVLSYFSGNLSSAADFGSFLRDLAGECSRREVATLLVHHTGKRKGHGGEVDPVYGGIGSSEFGNVPRLILTMEGHKDRRDIARLKIGKRASRSPWLDNEGNVTPEMLLQRSQDPNSPFWVPCPAEARDSAPPPPDRLSGARELIVTCLVEGDTDQKALYTKVHELGVSRDAFAKATKDLVEAGRIERFERPRSGTRPQIRYRLREDDGGSDDSENVI